MAIDRTLRDDIEKIAMPFVEEMELELVDLAIRRNRNNVHIQILADRKDGGITVEECSALNKKIGGVLENKNLLSNQYMLEVSSPGLDRPLKRRQDFLRVVGRKVRFFLEEPVGEKIEYAGTVEEIGDSAITIDDNGTKIALPFQAIRMGKQIIE